MRDAVIVVSMIIVSSAECVASIKSTFTAIDSNSVTDIDNGANIVESDVESKDIVTE